MLGETSTATPHVVGGTSSQRMLSHRLRFYAVSQSVVSVYAYYALRTQNTELMAVLNALDGKRMGTQQHTLPQITTPLRHLQRLP